MRSVFWADVSGTTMVACLGVSWVMDVVNSDLVGLESLLFMVVRVMLVVE